jgi:pimeloyl-ACP methyl ester carboxylesterase
VTEHPIFIPCGREYLAAVITLPASKPQGGVVFLQGLNSPRSHRYQLWTKSARRLAELNIASVRIDYPEVGDSTGEFPAVLDDPPVQEAETVARFLLEALGVSAVGVIGNCIGARAGLALARRMEQCVSVCCIVPQTPKSYLVSGGRSAPHRAAKNLAKKLPRLAKIARGVLHTERIDFRYHFVPDVPGAMRAADVLFIFLGKEEVARRLESELARLDDGSMMRGPYVHWIEAGDTSGMRIPIDLQERVIDEAIGWMQATLPEARRQKPNHAGVGQWAQRPTDPDS